MLKTFISINRKIVRFFTKDFTLNTEFYNLVVNYSKVSRRILEIGGSNRPMLNLSKFYFVVGCDIDETKDYLNCYDEFHLGEINTLNHGEFDLIFSSYLMEHVEDVKGMYIEQFKRVSLDGGKIVHIYPLGYHPYSIATKLADKLKITRRLISILRPEAIEVTGYKTYFNLGNIYDLELFLKKHPLVLNCTFKYAYSGSDYFAAIAPIGILIESFNRICEMFSLRYFASNVIVDITTRKSNLNQ